MGDSTKTQQRKLAKRIARLNTIQALFQMEASKQGMDYVARDFMENGFGEMIEEVKLPPPNKIFFNTLLLAVVNNQQKIDMMIHAQLPDSWSLDRIDPTIRAIFRASCAEAILNETPEKVIINEYIEITKSFFPYGKQVGFVNAIIEKVINELHPAVSES